MAGLAFYSFTGPLALFLQKGVVDLGTNVVGIAQVVVHDAQERRAGSGKNEFRKIEEEEGHRGAGKGADREIKVERQAEHLGPERLADVEYVEKSGGRAVRLGDHGLLLRQLELLGHPVRKDFHRVAAQIKKNAADRRDRQNNERPFHHEPFHG
ncbi:MAG: hypothetical protein ACREDG_02535, partial [Methylocella sp.]